jgi:hypothetical protein
LEGITLGGKTGQPGPQPLQTGAKKIGAEGQIEAQLYRTPVLAEATIA